MEDKLPDNFCVLPWSGRSAQPFGHLTPCCEFDPKFYSFESTDIDEYLNSDWLKNIKEQFLRGEWPKGCHICKNKESTGAHSKRLEENKLYKQIYGVENITLAMLENNDKSFLVNIQPNNQCNLGCVMCSSVHSSFIEKEVTQVLEDPEFEDDRMFYSTRQLAKVRDRHYSSKDIVKFANQIDTSNITNARLYITGGEPSVIKEVIVLLQKLLDEGLHDKFELEFNSNFFSFNPKFIDMVKHFRGHVMASVDAIGETGEFIRYPSNWERVEQNLLKFKNECTHFRLTLMPTIQMLNFQRIPELLKWANKHEIDVSLYNYLTLPEYLCARNLPRNIREETLQEIKQNFIVTQYTQDDLKRLETFILKDGEVKYWKNCVNKTLDSFNLNRNLNWQKTFPELIDILKD